MSDRQFWFSKEFGGDGVAQEYAEDEDVDGVFVDHGLWGYWSWGVRVLLKWRGALLLVVDDDGIHGLALHAGPLHIDGHGLAVG